MRNIEWLQQRIWRLVVALIVGCTIYLVGGVVTGVYDGFPSLVCQPPMAICITSLFILAAIITGIPLLLPRLKQLWAKAVWVNVGILVIGCVLLFFSQSFGLTSELTNPDTNQTFTGPSLLATVIGFFLLIFSIVNWPSKVLPSATGQD